MTREEFKAARAARRRMWKAVMRQRRSEADRRAFLTLGLGLVGILIFFGWLLA